jgi:uncharacterized protein YbjT (DUF2867 family)
LDRAVLLTGATGFVGRHLYPALCAAGWRVRCGTRDPDRAQALLGERDWTRVSTDEPAALRTALEGCDAAIYLIHSMGEGPGFARREREGAVAFREASRDAGVGRIVYLGAVVPERGPSAHLASRLETGEGLRSGPVPTLELRAGMIIGAGSQSWLIVRDLARRLPAMVLPRWLRNRSQPVAIDDVVSALCRGLEMPLPGSAVFDLPGPEVVSHRELLERVAAAFGQRPLMLDVPVLTPRLSSYWIFLFTRASTAVSRELVEGLTSDLVTREGDFFAEFPGCARTGLDEAIAQALLDETADLPPGAAAAERIARRAVEALGAARP